MEKIVGSYSFGGSGWRRELAVIHLEALVGEDSWQLFIWRLWLEKIVGSFIHLEALAGKESWDCYSRKGTVSVLVERCK